MRYFRHYLPFFIITTALYAAVFYHHQEVTVITLQPLNSGQQTVQLQFINKQQNTPADKSASKRKKEQNKPAEKLAAQKQQKTAKNSKKQQNQQHTAILSARAKSNSEITAASQKLQKSIRATTAKHDAQLKADLFTEELQQDTRTTEKRPEAPANKQPVSTVPPAKKMKKLAPAAHKVNEQIEQQHKKNKRIFKKKPAADNTPAFATVKDTGVLQEALVVSGNIPTYPKRAILRNQQGRVVVKLTVNIDGSAQEPEIITSSGHAILDTAVLDFINQERFMPAHRGTEKVSSQQIFAFRFELK